MHWREQLKSETCFQRKSSVSNMEEQFQQKRLTTIPDKDSREVQKLKRKIKKRNEEE